jgi:glutathione S-transferase
MSSLKLYYYPTGGRAGFIRLILNHADIPFEDVRIPGEDMDKEMDAHPKRFPMRTVPTLELEDGKTVLSQSYAIALYAAQRGNLLPTNATALALTHDMVFQSLDLFESVFHTMGKKDEELKQAREEWIANVATPSLKRIEALYESQSKDGPFFIGKQVTLVDFLAHAIVGFFKTFDLDYVPKTLVDAYPRVLKAAGAVKELDSVKTFTAKHPEL